MIFKRETHFLGEIEHSTEAPPAEITDGNASIGNQEQLETKPKRVVLEIGVGEFPHFIKYKYNDHFLKPGDQYIGLDYKSVKKAKEFLDSDSKMHQLPAGVEGKLIQGDGKRLPFLDESVDKVILPDILNSGSDLLNAGFTKYPTQIFDEALRVLKPGGKIIITEDNTVAIPDDYYPLLEKIIEDQSFEFSTEEYTSPRDPKELTLFSRKDLQGRGKGRYYEITKVPDLSPNKGNPESSEGQVKPRGFKLLIKKLDQLLDRLNE